MSNTNHIKRFATAQAAGHIVMLAFALASLANVEAFFAALHPGLPVLSWSLGIALGIGLVIMAALLSGMQWSWKSSKFHIVLGVTTGLALLSGSIQGAAYDAHMQSAVAAYILGLALPLIGELGVALAVSAYTQAQKAQRMSEAQSQLADGVQKLISESIAVIDPAKIEAQVARAANAITKALVDSTVNKMLQDLGDETGNLQETAHVAHVASGGADVAPRTGIEALNEARRAKIEDRRHHILSLIDNFGPMAALELVQRLRDDFGIEASDRTIKEDCKALGLLLDGRVWSRPIQAIANVAVEFSTNGHSH